MSWATFLKSHWESIAACDFLTVESWGLKGLTRYLIFFVIDLATRKVEIAGIHADPCETQMLQYARNLTDAQDGFLKGKRILIHDRDPLFTKRFQETLKAAGVRPLKLPKQSPNLNSVAESFVRNIKRECLSKMIFFSERQIRYAVSHYVEHYLTERPHRGLGNCRITEPEEPPISEGPVLCRERLGGLLKSYYRKAA
jgi:transposase InsO family protein